MVQVTKQSSNLNMAQKHMLLKRREREREKRKERKKEEGERMLLRGG